MKNENKNEMKTEKESVFAFFGMTLALAWMVAMPIVCCSGCMSNKGSHQNGLVFYVSTSGLGMGYGETEDVPMGATYRREIVTDTNGVIRTITEWNTAHASTNTAALVPPYAL